jgi:hypothetical protein
MDKKISYYITFSAFYYGITSLKIRKKSSQDRIRIRPGMDFYQDKNPAGLGWSLVSQVIFNSV